MKKLLFILLACLPLFGMAKDKKDNSDPKYLAGAITMEDGKVTFNHEIKAPSLSKEQLYQQMLDWANNRFKPDGKLQSRVVYTNEEKGATLPPLPKNTSYSLLPPCHWTAPASTTSILSMWPMEYAA